MPLCMGNVYTDSREGNYGQLPPFTTPSSSCLKGKQREHDGNSDVVDNASAHEHKRSYQTSTRTGGEFSDPGHLIFDSEQERHVAGTGPTQWNHFEPNTNTADLVPDLSAVPETAAHSRGDAVFQSQLSSSLPLSYDIESSWGPVSPTSSHVPIPDFTSYTPHFSCPMEEPMARYEFPENFDCASDSPSDTSDSTTHTSFVWIDSEPSFPEVFITHQDDYPFPTIDNSDVPLLYDSPSVANAEFTGGSLLGGLGPKTREPAPTNCKRKQLFVAEEGEYDERARKQPRIE